MEHGELDQSKVVNGQLLEARGDGAVLLEPADTALDHVTRTGVRRVVGHESAPLALAALLLGRDNRLDVMAAKPVRGMPAVVGAVRS